MPPRNLNIILLAIFISWSCHVTYRRAETAMMVGDAMEMIDRYYVDPVNQQDLLTAAMDGMTSTLDRHSEYIPGAAYETFQDSINQEFAGIGILVEQPDPEQPVRVITPLVGSPAMKAGLMPDDRIIRVDGKDVAGLEIRAVSERLKGPIHTDVTVTVRRGDRELEFTIRRDTIELESAIGHHRGSDNRWVYRLQEQPEIAYIRLTSFGEKTVRELRDVLRDLDNDFSGIVLDLRGNSGGLLYAASEVSNMFLETGRIVSTRTRGGDVEEVLDATAGTLVAPGKPVTVLIDGNSASASEIVAAALKDNGRATIVGTRSYGKGTVQNILPLQFGRSALRLTVARYYRPSGKNIHREEGATEEDVWGVQPNEGFQVAMDEEKLEQLVQRWRTASYPMLNTGGSPTAENSADSEQNADQAARSTASNDSDAAEPQTKMTSTLQLDPQLRRAVEHLRKQIENPSGSAKRASSDAA